MLRKNRAKLRTLLLFFGVLSWCVEADTCYAQDKSDEVKKLLKERCDLLSKVADQKVRIYSKLHTITLQEVIRADRDSLKADLDWFDKPEDRIRAIEKHNKAADSFLTMAEVRFTTARDLETIVLEAKAYVLEVQIELLKEKEKQKAKPGK